MVAARPAMRGVVFNLPTVVKAAPRSPYAIAGWRIEWRIEWEVLAGDFCFDTIGENYDLILTASLGISLLLTAGISLGRDLAFEREDGSLNAGAGFVLISSRALDLLVGPLDLDVGAKL